MHCQYLSVFIIFFYFVIIKKILEPACKNIILKIFWYKPSRKIIQVFEFYESRWKCLLIIINTYDNITKV